MAQPISIVIYVAGGLVTGVSTDLANPDDVRVAIADFDNGDQATEEDIAEGGFLDLSNEPFITQYASVGMELVASDPDAVEAIMTAANA